MRNKVLLVSDSQISGFSFEKTGTIEYFLFPLSTRAGHDIPSAINVHVLESAKKINKNANAHRQSYIDWIGGFSFDREILHPFYGFSMWWLSTVAEKNTLKSAYYYELMVFLSIIEAVKARQISEVVFLSDNLNIDRALGEFCHSQNIKYRSKCSEWLKKLNAVCSLFSHVLQAGNFFRKSVLKWLEIKYRSKKYPTHLPAESTVLGVNYFPYLNKEKAKRGIYESNFFKDLCLQNKTGRDTYFWLLMYVSNDKDSLPDAISIKNNFNAHGHQMHFIEEFLSLKSLLKVVLSWCAISLKFLVQKKRLRARHSFGADRVNIFSMLEPEWSKSFLGGGLLESLLYVECFRNFFHCYPKFSRGVYPYEMQVWERAMILARDEAKAETKLWGVQNTSTPKLHLSFFNSDYEMNESALPKPDGLMVNGRRSHQLFSLAGWKGTDLKSVEAYRYPHVKSSLVRSLPYNKENKILIAPTFHAKEAAMLLRFIKPWLGKQAYEFIFRPHPALSISKVNQLLKTDITLWPIQIKPTLSLEDTLKQVKAVCVGSSSVAVESLAYGCFIFSFHDPSMLILPAVTGLESQQVTDIFIQADLKHALDRLSSDYDQQKLLLEGRKVIKEYFNFNIDQNHVSTLNSSIRSLA